MIIFSTGASTITYVMNEMLEINYAVLVGSSCLLGTVIGMKILDKIMRKMNR